MQSRYKELVKNIGLITIGKALAKVVSILILPFYTTYLSPDDYGRIDMVTAYCGLFLQPVTLCIDSAIFIFPAKKVNCKKRKYYSSGFYFSFVPISLFCIAMYCLVFCANKNPAENFMGTLVRNAFMLCLLVISGFLSDFLQQMLRSMNKIALYATIGVLQSLAMIIFSLILLPRFGTRGYLLSLFFSSVFVVFVMFIHCRLWKWLSPMAISFRYYLQMLRYSLPLIPAPALLWVQTQSNRPLLATYWGMAAVGLFGFAIRFPATLNYFADSLCKSWEISALHEHDKLGFSSFYNNLCMLFFFVGSIVCILLPLIIEPVFKILIKEDFYPSIQYVPVVSLSIFCSICGQLLGTNLTVRKQSYKFFWSGIVAAIVVGVGNFLLIPRFGVWVACVSMLSAAVAVMVVRYVMSDSMFRILALAKIVIGVFLLLMWCVGYTTHGDDLTVKIGITCLALASFAFVFSSNIKGWSIWLLRR